ncbi:hypothetical protein BH11MYX2_BH11MYX2_21380 [soil metagenome]
MRRIALLLGLAACGSKSHEADVGSANVGSANEPAPPPPAASGSQGYLLWAQAPAPPARDEVVLVRPNDHLMLMDGART